MEYRDTSYKVLVENKVTKTRHETARLIENSERENEVEKSIWSTVENKSDRIEREETDTVIEYGRSQKIKKMPERFKDMFFIHNNCVEGLLPIRGDLSDLGVKIKDSIKMKII